MYGPLDDPNAVISALNEFDKIGRAAFLNKYGFDEARQYFVLYKGKYYDSKAILGAAYGFQHGKALSSSDFGGGKNTVQPKLKKLGFTVISTKAIEQFALPEETTDQQLWEGATTSVRVNVYERSTEARKACISAKGSACAICSFDFSEAFGLEFAGFIHVHHIVPLANGDGLKRKVDPETDLVPVCPNCHAILHFGGKTRSIDDVKSLRWKMAAN